MEKLQLVNSDVPKDTSGVDVDEVASRIAANAGQVTYPDRTSEAARDQGWGPVTLPGYSEPDARASRQKVPPYKGKVRGDSELDGSAAPVGHEPYSPLTPAEQEAGRLSLAAVRHALERKNDHK